MHSPEGLLLALETEIAMRRAKREHAGRHRAAILAAGLVLILGGAGLALCALFSTLSERPHGATAGNAPTQIVAQP